MWLFDFARLLRNQSILVKRIFWFETRFLSSNANCLTNKKTNKKKKFPLKNPSTAEAHQPRSKQLIFGKCMSHIFILILFWFVYVFFFLPNMSCMQTSNYHKSTFVNLCQQNLTTFLLLPAESGTDFFCSCPPYFPLFHHCVIVNSHCDHESSTYHHGLFILVNGPKPTMPILLSQ